MIEYSLENLGDQIYHSKTKEYFEEVIQTYYTRCYRSSVVMLYSVVICDLIFKLEDLRDVYDESKADKILLEIEKLQKANPKSPDWENKLIELIEDRMSLLEISDIENIRQLQKHRHLSAHPVLNQSSILFKPNKDTVKAHIRNMLEGVLTKPPILSAKIFNSLIVDIADNQYRFSSKKELRLFLNAKYFKNLRQETLNSIFKKLWKFVYKTSNNDCDKNRDINLKTLEIIYEIDTNSTINYIKNEQIYYEGILKGEPTMYLFKMLFKYPKIYTVLSDVTKAYLEFESKNDMNYTFLSSFKFSSFNLFITHLTETVETSSNFWIHYDIISSLKERAIDDFYLEKEFIDLAILVFGRSNTYNTADFNFTHLIEPYLDKLTNTQIITLLGLINSNSQINSRKAARSDNKKIKDICTIKLPASFDYSPYPFFS